jgi:hypothetical protein
MSTLRSRSNTALNASLHALETETPGGKDSLVSSLCLGVCDELKLEFLLAKIDQQRIELGPALIHGVVPVCDFGATSGPGNPFSAA